MTLTRQVLVGSNVCIVASLLHLFQVFEANTKLLSAPLERRLVATDGGNQAHERLHISFGT